MADQTAALARGVDEFVRNVRNLCSRIERDEYTPRDIEGLWSDWTTIVRWSLKFEKPHNYSRGVLAARKFRECLDVYGLDD